jgi:hypothetical protein
MKHVDRALAFGGDQLEVYVAAVMGNHPADSVQKPQGVPATMSRMV